jgi:PAS domain S-box-containing protein
MKSNSFLLKIALALFIGCVFLVGVGLASYVSISSLIDSANRRARAENTLTLLDHTFATFDVVETKLRKYMVTGDASDREEWQLFRDQSRENRLKLQALTQLPELTSVNAIFAERRDLALKAVDARNSAGAVAALRILDSGEFRSLRVRGTSLLEEVRDRERAAAMEADAASRGSALRTQKLIIAIGVLFLSMLAWFVYLISHYERARNRLNDRLKDSEALSRSITEGMAEGVITMDDKNVILEVNQSAQQLFLYKREEMLGRHFSKLLPQKASGDFETLSLPLDDETNSLKLADQEVPCRRKDGSEFLAFMSLSKGLVNNRTVRTVLVQDITERKTAADALRSSEFLLRQVTDTVPALIAYLDADEKFRFHNKAYEEVLGLGFDQISGRPLSEVLGEKAYENAREKVQEVLRGYVVRYERVLLTPRGGLRTYAMEYFPRYSDDAGEGKVVGFFSMGTDITELKRIDQMKTEFISTVSHELRTPLTSIRGSLGLISGGVAGELPDAIKNLVQIAKNNCERLIRLINDILDSEKIESGKMQMNLQVLDVRKLVEQVMSQNQGFAVQHHVKLQLTAHDSPFYASVDSDRLIQVLTNLLSNAVKFSPAGDVVEIKLFRADMIRIEVVDHGPGISEQFRVRIFQKFSQADSSDSRQKGGTGLGLNISRSIIEKMNGTIGFSTLLGAGSTFFIELLEWRFPDPALPPISPRATASRPRILICEDDRDVARLIGIMLSQAGFEIDTTDSAEEALARLKVNHYAAMTVDINLPGENGIAFISKLRNTPETSGIPIVVVSASARDGMLELDHMPLSISDWLEKPINEEGLTKSVRRAVASLNTLKPRILHVEDDPDIQHIVSEIGKDIAVFQFAPTLDEARARLREYKFDLVLLDLSLGKESGWDLIQDIDCLDPRPPVIIFSASDIESHGPRNASAVLVKSQTSNAELLRTIQRVLDMPEEAVPLSPSVSQYAPAA